MARTALKNIFNLLDTAKAELPPEQSFLNDLRRSIELTDEKNSDPGSKAYKPSGMNCMRQSFYVITGAAPDPANSNSNLVGICESGSDRHERIQDAVLHMKDNDMDCEYVNVADFVKQRELKYLKIVKRPNFKAGRYETKLYHKTLNMSFLCDGIIRYKNHYYILEIKTESSNKFFMRKGVDPSHYNQATAYSMAFGINEVIFLYESRDTLDKKAFLFNVTDEMRMNLLGYIEECDRYIKAMKVPEKPVNVMTKTCNYCKYKNQCRKDG